MGSGNGTATAPCPVCHGSVRCSTPFPVPRVRALLCVPASCPVLWVLSLPCGPAPYSMPRVRSLLCTLPCMYCGSAPYSPVCALSCATGPLPTLYYGSAPICLTGPVFTLPRVRSLLCTAPFPVLRVRSLPCAMDPLPTLRSLRLPFLCCGSGPFSERLPFVLRVQSLLPRVRSILGAAPFPAYSVPIESKYPEECQKHLVKHHLPNIHEIKSLVRCSDPEIRIRNAVP